MILDAGPRVSGPNRQLDRQAGPAVLPLPTAASVWQFETFPGLQDG